MSPPRKPRGEKPATTIRLLRRQMVTMQHTITALRMACDDKDKVVAGFDVQMSEQEDQIRSLQDRNIDQATTIEWVKEKLRQSAERTAFLEGYYAKSQETTPQAEAERRVQAALASVPRDTPQTHPGSGSRDPQGVQVRRQDAAQERALQSAGGLGAAPGHQIRRAYRDDPQHPEKSPVEHVKIKGHDPCPQCLGTGLRTPFLPISQSPCPNCNGTGHRGG